MNKDEATKIARRILDRVEQDRALHLDSLVEEIMAGFALVTPGWVHTETIRRVEAPPFAYPGSRISYTECEERGWTNGIMSNHGYKQDDYVNYWVPAECPPAPPPKPKEVNPLHEGQELPAGTLGNVTNWGNTAAGDMMRGQVTNNVSQPTQLAEPDIGLGDHKVNQVVLTKDDQRNMIAAGFDPKYHYDRRMWAQKKIGIDPTKDEDETVVTIKVPAGTVKGDTVALFEKARQMKGGPPRASGSSREHIRRREVELRDWTAAQLTAMGWRQCKATGDWYP
jgi:hypothetical protein